MKTDYSKYERECEFLISIGFVKTYFAYSTGGGEDENGEDLFIKGNIALEWDYLTGKWSKHNYSDLTYSNFLDQTGEVLNIYDLA